MLVTTRVALSWGARVADAFRLGVGCVSGAIFAESGGTPSLLKMELAESMGGRL